MKPKLSDLWRWSGKLERGPYLFWGVLLFALKFNLDRIIGAVWFGKPWSLFDWKAAQLYLWQSPMAADDKIYLAALLAASLPFLWAGTVLTMRRLRSLDWHPAWVLFFFVPVLKLVFFALLCLLPSRQAEAVEPAADSRAPQLLRAAIPRSGFGSALLAVVLTALLSIAGAWLGTSVFLDYGWTIFIGLPFAMGFLSVLIYGFHEPRGLGKCLGVACSTVLVCGLGMLLFAFEGMICLLMAAPLALAVAAIGGAIGYVVQKSFRWRDEVPRLYCVVVLAMPCAMGREHAAPPALPLLEVKSSVIVDAPPEKVWSNVVAFAELPPPHETIFKLGVAYPVYAKISGRGVGAVRHCNFSTGPFVEPIEVWDEPRLLKFSVTQNPEPMQEWTPYRHVHPAHLDGYLESRAGQFRLVPLPGGRTQLEGTTWYYHRLWPAAYWQVWSDHIIHTIHLRVLNHVKQLSERKDV
jgi:uncharacterized membrane protein YhaH (DUF805 family)